MQVRYEVLTAASMKTVIFDVALCSLVQIYRRFRGTYCLHYHRLDDGGSNHFRNVSFLRDYIVQYRGIYII
jgi:hypothetical protein